MKNQIVKAQDFGLSENQVSNVDVAFSAKVKERQLIYEIYSQIIKKDINSEVAKEARELRLKAVKEKTGIASIHKTQKEFSLAYGKYCDAWKRKETEPLQQMIDHLLEIEKFDEIQRQKKLEELQKQRENQLSPYVDDAKERDLSGMDDDVWEAYLIKKKKDYEDRIKAEKKAEEERIAKEKAEAEERERIKKENEKLRKEAQERELLAKKEEEERKAKEEAERKMREEKERKERESYEAKLKAEREEKEKIRLELEAKQEAERKAKEEEKQKIQEELNKGDESKIQDLILDIESLKKKYVFKSQKNIKLYKDVSELFDKVITFINN